VRAVLLRQFGDADGLYIGNAPNPVAELADLLVRVHATALNRADILQRRGHYPAPEGTSEILGLEMAGEVIAVGSQTAGWSIGDRVCALLPGGGYAQQVVVPAIAAMRLPDNLSYEAGAAIPEVFLTAYLNLVKLGGFTVGDTVLIHAGASGVGTAAIQLVRELGGHALVTAGSAAKLAKCAELGADAGWNYKTGDFAAWVRGQTGGQGVDIILDFVGAPYFHQNIESLAIDGRLIIVGTLGGAKVADVNLGTLLGRRLQVIGTALRSRTPAQKAALVSEFVDFALPRFADGRLLPIVDSVYDWQEVKQAHERMESNQNTGKIVLRVQE